MFELAMASASCHEEPAIIVEHSQYLAHLHPLSPSGVVYKWHMLLRHNELRGAPLAARPLERQVGRLGLHSPRLE